MRSVGKSRILGESDHGCVEDQPQKATFHNPVFGNFPLRLPHWTLLRLVFERAAVHSPAHNKNLGKDVRGF